MDVDKTRDERSASCIDCRRTARYYHACARSGGSNPIAFDDHHCVGDRSGSGTVNQPSADDGGRCLRICDGR